MALSIADKTNFETLCQAVCRGHAVLMECQLVATGEPVAVLCLISGAPDGRQVLIPCAQLFQADPYTLVNPPHPERPGFATQAEVWGAAAT